MGWVLTVFFYSFNNDEAIYEKELMVDSAIQYHPPTRRQMEDFPFTMVLVFTILSGCWVAAKVRLLN